MRINKHSLFVTVSLYFLRYNFCLNSLTIGKIQSYTKVANDSYSTHIIPSQKILLRSIQTEAEYMKCRTHFIDLLILGLDFPNLLYTLELIG